MEDEGTDGSKRRDIEYLSFCTKNSSIITYGTVVYIFE